MGWRKLGGRFYSNAKQWSLGCLVIMSKLTCRKYFASLFLPLNFRIGPVKTTSATSTSGSVTDRQIIILTNTLLKHSVPFKQDLFKSNKMCMTNHYGSTIKWSGKSMNQSLVTTHPVPAMFLSGLCSTSS